ncbi:MAG: DHHA1 domain-containing protein [Leptonema sp. (in: bacteria)]
MWVIFHKQCLDGTASASAVLKKYPEVRLFPISHSYTEIQEILKLKEETIFILDFMLSKKDIEILLKNKNQVIHIDHHTSCSKEVEHLKKYENFTSIFDLNHSASYLAWNYLHNFIPKLIFYIEDRDLWKKQFKETDVLCYYLFSKVLDKPEQLLNYLETPIEEIYQKGIIVQEYIESNIQQILEKNEPIWLHVGGMFRKHKIPAINSNIYISEIGNELAKRYSGIACIFSISDGTVHLSFRSIEGTILNAKDMAEHFGGGGHKHASGARISIKKFFKLIK